MLLTAGGSIVIDKRKLQLFQKESILGEPDIDAATVQTEVEVLKSDNIGLAVVRKLHLADDPEFTGSSKGPVGHFMALLGSLTGFSVSERVPTESERENAALLKFDAQRTLNRVGMTYVIDIGFTSRDPDKSARLVNALADAYIDNQLDAKFQATRRVSIWLQERISELRTQATLAERAVLDFKAKNNIVDTGGGRLIGDQDLAEVNSQLIVARAATAEAKAPLDRINTVMQQDVADAPVADALKSEVIIKLRGQYLELAQREAIWSRTYGENHLAAVNLRTQMQELRHSIKDEMGKIDESYKSEYEIALTRQNSLEASLANVVSQSQPTGKAQIQSPSLKATRRHRAPFMTTFSNAIWRRYSSNPFR